MKILICPDKFKGSLHSNEVANALKEGILKKNSDFIIRIITLADGGEGSSEILGSNNSSILVNCKARDPLGRTIDSFYYYSPSKKAAFIDMSAASGIALLKEQERNPLLTSSIGTADLINHAMSNNVEQIILCLGGSATNDAGLGMAYGLGFEFFSTNYSKVIPNGGNISEVNSITIPNISFPKITLLHDVNNPMTGTNGATHTFARQKGATEEAIRTLEKGLVNICHLIEKYTDKNMCGKAGMGAAGGLSLIPIAFMGASLEQGFHRISNESGLDKQIAWADRVITGEGKLDFQSKQGKVVGEVEKICEDQKKPLTIVCGEVDQYASTNPIYSILESTDAGTKESAQKYAYRHLVEIGEMIY